MRSERQEKRSEVGMKGKSCISGGNRILDITINDTGASGKLWTVESAYILDGSPWILCGKYVRISVNRVEQSRVRRLLWSSRWQFLGIGMAAVKSSETWSNPWHVLKVEKTGCANGCGLIWEEKRIQEWLSFWLERQVEQIHRLTRQGRPGRKQVGAGCTRVVVNQDCSVGHIKIFLMFSLHPGVNHDERVKSGMPMRHPCGYVKKILEHVCLEFRCKVGFDDRCFVGRKWITF